MKAPTPPTIYTMRYRATRERRYSWRLNYASGNLQDARADFTRECFRKPHLYWQLVETVAGSIASEIIERYNPPSL